MNDHATASTALATVAPQAPVDFDAALRRMAAGSVRQTPRDAAPQTPAIETGRALNDEGHALADKIAEDVLAFLARQLGHKAPDVREPSEPHGGGAVAADLHSRACLNAKLRRLAEASALFASKIG